MEEEYTESEYLHSNCECKQGTSHDHSKQPRPPDHDEDDYDTDLRDDLSDDDKTPVSPVRLFLQGKTIVPHFPYLGSHDPSGLARTGGSLGVLTPHHPDLVWAGSSCGTMHKVPVRSLNKNNVGSHVIGELQRTPSIMSKKSKLSSCRLSTQTVSESGTDYYTFCRICQMGGDVKDPLFSPCRCSGSLRYIHSTCLKKWIRISQRRGKKQPPRCELCHYQFTRHKRFKFSQWRWPRVRPRDKFLHIIFLLNLIIMIGCAIATVMCFLSDRGNAVKFPKNKVRLTSEEVITLTCGVTFFVAFFIAMTVEIKARHTLYKLFTRFIMHNTEWTVEHYDPNKDPMYKRAPISVV